MFNRLAAICDVGVRVRCGNVFSPSGKWNGIERKGDGIENKLYFAPLELNDRMYVRAETANSFQNRTFAFSTAGFRKFPFLMWYPIISMKELHFIFHLWIQFVYWFSLDARAKIFDGMLLFLITRIQYLWEMAPLLTELKIPKSILYWINYFNQIGKFINYSISLRPYGRILTFEFIEYNTSRKNLIRRKSLKPTEPTVFEKRTHVFVFFNSPARHTKSVSVR